MQIRKKSPHFLRFRKYIPAFRFKQKPEKVFVYSSVASSA